MQTETSDYLFVYGTLTKQSGHPMHRLLQLETEYVDAASLQGRLYDLGHYPGVILSSLADEKVYGELYKIHRCQPLLAQLDDYEECSPAFKDPHEYVRRIVTVTTTDQQQIQAWCYLYNRSIACARYIVSGRYF